MLFKLMQKQAEKKRIVRTRNRGVVDNGVSYNNAQFLTASTNRVKGIMEFNWQSNLTFEQ